MGKNPENQNFEKMKKTPGDIIILHKCTKNHDYMLHCSWDMMCDQCNCYFSFWATFCLFTHPPLHPPNSPKNENLNNMKKVPGDAIILHKCTKKIMVIYYTVPEIWHMTHIIIIFHFGLFFALLKSKKSNFKKKKERKRKFWRCHHFTPVYHKFWLEDVRFLRYGAQRTDGQTDGKSDIEVGAPPKNW